MITLFATLASATAPTVSVQWKKADSELQIRAPEGEKFAEEAPALLAFEGNPGLSIELPGRSLAYNLPIPDARGTTLQGVFDVSLCNLDGSSCRMTSWTVSGSVGDDKRGSVDLQLVAAAAEPEPHASPFGPEASQDAAAAAFRAAKNDGKPVLLDFSAVWCPPCNLLAAEVLHSTPPPSVLEGVHVAILDVDHPSSFAHKATYDIGSYPTVVLVDPEGGELARVVGYPGKEEFVHWLEGAESSTEAAELAAGPEEATPSRRAELAWVLAQRHRFDRAKTWLEGAEESADAVLTRLAMEPTAADLQWIVDQAPDRAEDAIGAILGLDAKHNELRRRALELASTSADPGDLPDLLYVAAEVADPTMRATLMAAAATALRSQFVGTPAADKGHYTWYATLLTESGQPDAALAFLVEANEQFPGDPTFDLSAARILADLDRHEESLAVSERAAKTAWGDNALRVAAQRAKSLIALNRPDEARGVLNDALAASPPAEQNVRTHRYRRTLEGLLEEE